MILSNFAKQNNVINGRLREKGKQNELTYKDFMIWITRASLKVTR